MVSPLASSKAKEQGAHSEGGELCSPLIALGGHGNISGRGSAAIPPVVAVELSKNGVSVYVGR